MKDLFFRRTLMIQLAIGLLVFIYITKLFFIQVVDESSKSKAENNAILKLRIQPARGLIYDRNKKLIVYNEAVYDIMVIPKEVKKFDTTQLCNLLSVDKELLKKQLGKAYSYSRYNPSVLLSQVSVEDYARFQEYLSEFYGFYGNVRTIRFHPYHCAAHVLGYISEVSEKDIENSEGFYEEGDYIGKNGIELAYDQFLRGQFGLKVVFIDALRRMQGSFQEGKLDKEPVVGANLVSTLDVDLQQYAEELMKNKRGSVVAIEPKTGEILAMVSSPSYDPNLMSGRKRGENYAALLNDSLKPLFNRPISAQYPPGSTFKAMVALAGLKLGAIQPDFSYHCSGVYAFGGFVGHCSHGHPSAANVMDGLKYSCNPYFWQVFRNSVDLEEQCAEGYQNWYETLLSFGVGKPVGFNVLGEKSGNLPKVSYFNRLYGEGRWKSITIVSLGIGQGEILMTPLQLANCYALIANRGYYVEPHLIKQIEGDETDYLQKNLMKHQIYVNPELCDYVIEGLHQVVLGGTARASKIPSIEMAGKTGTAQNPHGDNHSIFAGFGPYDNPKIVVAAVVENAGGGATYAAPISSLVIEKFINDTIATSRKPLEKRILNANLLK